jgi:hypothetical protein
VLLQRRIDPSIAQGFGFVVPARGRGNTPRISSSRAGATEPKNKRAARHYASGAALVAQVTWISVWAAASPATAQPTEPLRVERGPGAETCPSAPELAARVEAIRGQPSAAASNYSVEFMHDGHAYAAVLRSGENGSSLRSLQSSAAECAALAQATAVTLALLFDADAARAEAAEVPGPPAAGPRDEDSPPSAAAAAEVPPPKPRPQLGLALGASLVEGLLRPWAPAFLGELNFSVDRLRFGLGAFWLPTQHSKLDPGTVELGLLAANARVCYAMHRNSGWQVDGCSGFTLGSISAAASGYTRHQPDTARFFAALPLEIAVGRSTRHVGWQLSGVLLIPFRRNQFEIDGIGRVYDSPALAALLVVRAAGWIEL